MENKDLEIKDLGFGIIYTTETKQDVKWKDKWQKLKEFISNRSSCAGYVVQARLIWDILDKMRELEGEDE